MSARSRDPVDTNGFADLLAAAEAGAPLDARQATLNGRAIKALIEVAPRRNGHPVLNDVSFGGATFVGPVSFADVIFKGDSGFSATFEDNVYFSRATFEGYAGFGQATFEAEARFDRATFEGRADFQDTTWKGQADFVGATFSQDARFWGPTVFSEDARFDGALFKGHLFVSTFEADLWFAGATFEVARDLGHLRVNGRVILDGAVFAQRLTIVVRAKSISAAGTEFRSGVDIYAQSATIALDGAAFGAPSTLSAATGDTTYGALLGGPDHEQTIPRVVSLQGARVADLALYGVDLRACRFRTAHGLDRLHLEQVLFAETPTGWHTAKRWPFPMRWTRRLAIAEEHRWRAEQQRADGWWTAALRIEPSSPHWRESDPPTPHQVAAVYRALRKAQEERKDEPGAADFYYGEMEMRRATRYRRGEHAGADSASPLRKAEVPLDSRSRQDSTRRTPVGERVVLFLYWLTSGYGMRASRPLIALGVTVACGALLLSEFGLETDASYWRSLLYAFESSVSLLRAPEVSLTPGGELVTIMLRLLGPLFFGLALLSLRGRVKR